jgi:GNAT superfamily N-acetyltransferase
MLCQSPNPIKQLKIKINVDTKNSIERIETSALKAEYYIDSLESEVIGVRVACLQNLKVINNQHALTDLQQFFNWCDKQQVDLCSCRVPQFQRHEALLLEQARFHWIELNYRPQLDSLQSQSFDSGGIEILKAELSDRPTLQNMAAQMFDYGRFHQDPRLGSDIGNRRYSYWLKNAFNTSHQEILKCVFNGTTIGFFVIEQPIEHTIFWSLVGLDRQWWGQGLGTRTWNAVLNFHQQAGIQQVITSISSHNLPAFNLYIRLGWRFPSPLLTFHWCR